MKKKKKSFSLNQWLLTHGARTQIENTSCTLQCIGGNVRTQWSLINKSEHNAQPCNLLLGTVQAACLTENKVRQHLLLGSPLGAFY